MADQPDAQLDQDGEQVTGHVNLHRHAGGLPRLVNALCYRSILHAAAHDIKIIDSSNIVTDDLFD